MVGEDLTVTLVKSWKRMQEVILWCRDHKISEFKLNGFEFSFTKDAFLSQIEIKPPLVLTQIEAEKKQQEEEDIRFWSA